MYLSTLSEEEKVLFIGLAYNVAMADGVYCEEEKLMMESYCNEMQIMFEQENMVKPVNDIIEEMNDKCGMREKKIFVFEAIGLAMSDNNFDITERRIVNEMMEKFKIPEEFSVKCEQIIQEYIEFQAKIKALVIG